MGEEYLMQVLKARRIKRKTRVQRMYLCVFSVRCHFGRSEKGEPVLKKEKGGNGEKIAPFLN